MQNNLKKQNLANRQETQIGIFHLGISIDEMMAKTESLQIKSKSVLHAPCRKLGQL